jgi:hypothetical protein
MLELVKGHSPGKKLISEAFSSTASLMEAVDFWLARMFHELLSRDHKDGRATWQPQGVGSEAYLNGTSQGPTPEDAGKDDHICGCSKSFMKYPGFIIFDTALSFVSK